MFLITYFITYFIKYLFCILLHNNNELLFQHFRTMTSICFVCNLPIMSHQVKDKRQYAKIMQRNIKYVKMYSTIGWTGVVRWKWMG